MGRKRREYTYDDWKRAMDMLRAGYKPSEASVKLGINKYTVKNWKNGAMLPLAKWKTMPFIELACVIGSLEDGCVSKNESWH